MAVSTKTVRLAVLSMLSALTVLVAYFPVRFVAFEISLCPILVCIGAVLYGVKGGAVLGTVFGLASFSQAFGFSPFGTLLFTLSPWSMVVVCIPTRIVSGLLTGLLFEALTARGSRWVTLGTAVSALAAPLSNTVCFMTALLLLFWKSEPIQGFAAQLGTASPLWFAVLFVGLNGLVEIGSCFLVGLPVSRALHHVVKRGH